MFRHRRRPGSPGRGGPGRISAGVVEPHWSAPLWVSDRAGNAVLAADPHIGADPHRAGPSVAACPTVVDLPAGLAFDCLVKSMRVTADGPYLNVLVARTESSPDWYMSELTARVQIAGRSIKAIADVALRQLSSDFYPANSAVRAVSRRPRTVSGRPAVYLDARIKTNKTRLPYKELMSVRDRVVIVVVGRRDGTASELIIVVPDTRRRLWRRMDGVAARLRLV